MDRSTRNWRSRASRLWHSTSRSVNQFLAFAQRWLASTFSKVTHGVYWILWLGAWVNMIDSYLTLLTSRSAKLGIVVGPDIEYFLAGLYGLITIAFLTLVYNDIHKIDNNEEPKDHLYAKWLGRPLELVLRYLVFTSLLFGAGKLLSALAPIGTGTRWLVHQMNPEIESVIAKGISHVEIDLFVVGALLTYGFLAIWNFGAWNATCAELNDFIKYRKIASKHSDLPPEARKAETYTRKNLAIQFVNVYRTFWYMISSALAYAYWLNVHSRVASTAAIGTMLFWLYVFATLRALWFSLPMFRRRVIAKKIQQARLFF